MSLATEFLSSYISKMNNIESTYLEMLRHANRAFIKQQKIRQRIIKQMPKSLWFGIGWKTFKDIFRTDAILGRRSRRLLAAYRKYASDNVKKDVYYQMLIAAFPLVELARYIKDVMHLTSKEIKQLIKLNEQKKKQLTFFTPFTVIGFLITAAGLASKIAPKEFFDWIKWKGGYETVQIGGFIVLSVLYLFLLPLPLWKYLKLKYQYENLERILNYCEILSESE